MQANQEAPSRIERLVLSPVVRSTYVSLLGHVAVLVILARLVTSQAGLPRPRPIVIAAADRSVPPRMARATWSKRSA